MEWTIINLSSKLFFTCGVNVKYFKSGHHPLPTLPVGIRNTLTIFKTNQSVRVSRYIFFLVKLKGRGRHFLDGAKRGATLWYYTQEHLVFIRDEKVSLFVKFEIILTPFPLFLFNPLTDNHCRTWSSMIILWIDSRTRQKYRMLLSTRKRSNNYSWLTPFKRKCFGNMMLSRWPCFTWSSSWYVFTNFLN